MINLTENQLVSGSMYDGSRIFPGSVNHSSKEITIYNMQDSDPRPASNRRPNLKSIAVSHFRKSTCNDVTDVCSK